MPGKPLLEAIATLVGFTIGAGILGIPYVIAKAGFVTGIINILIIGILVLFLNLYSGEIVLRTKGDHQLTGYASIYLGKTGKFLMAISIIFGFDPAQFFFFSVNQKNWRIISGPHIAIISLVE